MVLALAFFVIVSIVLLFLLIHYTLTLKKMNFFISRVLKHDSNASIKSFSNNLQLQELTKHINELIEMNAKLSNTYNQTVTQYQKNLAMLGHDFKTPATSILGYLELLQSSTSIEDQQRYGRIIYQRVSHLNHMINQFFLISVLEHNRYVYQIERVKPISLLQDQLFHYYEQLNGSYQTIDIKLTDLNFEIECDKQALIRIYDNIIINAFDYGRGTLKISNELGVVVFSNEINHNTLKKSTGFGLQIIQEFKEELGFDFNIQQTDSHYFFKLELK